MAHDNVHWHRRLIENKGSLMAVLSVVAISVGSLVEIIPMLTVEYTAEQVEGIHPYTALEVGGRDIYVREGCYLCHSQWVRPFRAETLRYGDWSRAGEYVYDRPFQLGSRRIGPDLHRIGGKYNDAWHYEHMKDPRSTSPGSIMPAYQWMHEDRYDKADIEASVQTLATLGHPYTEEQLADVGGWIDAQAAEVRERLADANIQVDGDEEIVAVIAYLQRLGTDGKNKLAKAAAESATPASVAPGGE